MKAEFDVDRFRRIAVVPFESVHKYMATLNQTPTEPGRSCSKVRRTGCWTAAVTSRMPTGARSHWTGSSGTNRSTTSATRVCVSWLRPCVRRVRIRPSWTMRTFRAWCPGACGHRRPPRPDAIEAIATCQQAGIVVKMITGDHAGTATAISREMGIVETAAQPRSAVRNWSGRPTPSCRRSSSRPTLSHAPAPSTNCDWSRHCRPTGRS